MSVHPAAKVFVRVDYCYIARVLGLPKALVYSALNFKDL